MSTNQTYLRWVSTDLPGSGGPVFGGSPNPCSPLISPFSSQLAGLVGDKGRRNCGLAVRGRTRLLVSTQRMEDLQRSPARSLPTSASRVPLRLRESDVPSFLQESSWRSLAISILAAQAPTAIMPVVLPAYPFS